MKYGITQCFAQKASSGYTARPRSNPSHKSAFKQTNPTTMFSIRSSSFFCLLALFAYTITAATARHASLVQPIVHEAFRQTSSAEASDVQAIRRQARRFGISNMGANSRRESRAAAANVGAAFVPKRNRVRAALAALSQGKREAVASGFVDKLNRKRRSANSNSVLKNLE